MMKWQPRIRSRIRTAMPTTGARSRHWVLAFCGGMFAASVLASCATEREPSRDPQGPSARDWIVHMRDAHGRADAAMSATDPDNARQALQRALAVAVPTGVHAEHRRVVAQDLLFRLAQIALLRGMPDEARDAAERGLAMGAHDDIFTANLMMARGQALEAQKREPEAAASYHEALLINEKLLAKVLGRHLDHQKENTP